MPPQVFIHGELDLAEQRVLGALCSLPNEAIIYAQPLVVHKSERKRPDFVIAYKEWGVVILEVKDWVEVLDVEGEEAEIRQRNGEIVWRGSPIKQAEQAAWVLVNELERDEDLLDYRGRLDFSYACGGVTPHLGAAGISRLEAAWGESYILGPADLRPDRITNGIASIHVPFRIRLNQRQVDAIRATIDRRNKAIDRPTGSFKGIYDLQQESAAKEALPSETESTSERQEPTQAALDLGTGQPEQAARDVDLAPTPAARIQHLEEGMPDEVKSLKSAPHVRLLRGFAGTGKTDVLILRAHYLYDRYPDLQILVTTFNKLLYEQRLEPELHAIRDRVDPLRFNQLCARIYHQKLGRWPNPQKAEGIVALMEPKALVEQFGEDFLSEEFVWMKETGRAVRHVYVNTPREGRGSASGRTLGTRMKNQIFDLFEIYKDMLQELPADDWVDLHNKAWRYLEEGIEPEKRYDVVLIDEAQHFAPTWMRIVEHFLKPEGHLFLCDDPTQSVYRYYSWRQKGVEVVGRTRWLRIPYRNTRQTFDAAYSLIADNELARKQVAESGLDVRPDLESVQMRDGPVPEVHHFSSVQAEREFVCHEIQRLMSDGLFPREIGVLHDQLHVLRDYGPLVPSGVQLNEIRAQTGLEYKAVFVPQVQQLLERRVGVGWEEDKARMLFTFYMTMTRARDRLYLLHCQQWPRLLEPVRPHVEWIEHPS